MQIELIILFFVVALLYSSVGFGGGSSYLAILALYGFDFRILRFVALLCNIVVVSGGSINFYRKGILSFREALPFIIFSIPAAFLGGAIKTNEIIFFITLGIVLVIASLFLWAKNNYEFNSTMDKKKNWFAPLVGTAIGFLSGFVGIGGGIFLSPVLHFTGWGNSQKIAATSSFFILCNSISGISGQLFFFQGVDINWVLILPLVLAVLVGGLLGSKISTNTNSTVYIRKATSLLILFVGIRVLYTNLAL